MSSCVSSTQQKQEQAEGPCAGCWWGPVLPERSVSCVMSTRQTTATLHPDTTAGSGLAPWLSEDAWHTERLVTVTASSWYSHGNTNRVHVHSHSQPLGCEHRMSGPGWALCQPPHRGHSLRNCPQGRYPHGLGTSHPMQLQSGHQPCFGWCPADSGLQAAAWPLIFLDQNMLFQESERSSAEDKDASV